MSLVLRSYREPAQLHNIQRCYKTRTGRNKHEKQEEKRAAKIRRWEKSGEGVWKLANSQACHHLSHISIKAALRLGVTVITPIPTVPQVLHIFMIAITLKIKAQELTALQTVYHISCDWEAQNPFPQCLLPPWLTGWLIICHGANKWGTGHLLNMQLYAAVSTELQRKARPKKSCDLYVCYHHPYGNVLYNKQ